MSRLVPVDPEHGKRSVGPGSDPQGDAPHLRLVVALQWGIALHLAVAHIEGVLHGLQRLSAHGGGDHAAHLHFAVGDQAKVDALLRKAVEQIRGDAGATHDPGAADAEFGHATFGTERATEIFQVGSGWSSRVAANAAQRTGSTLQCIDPYPRAYIQHLDIDFRKERIQNFDPHKLSKTLSKGDCIH